MRVVLIGGGSGISTIAPYFLGPGIELLTAVVTVADDGGSTGDLRKRTGLPAMGDIRKIISRLATSEKIAKILESRFNGISTGNLQLVEHMQRWGVEEGIQKLSASVLKPGCEVLPVTTQSTRLVAVLDDGTFLRKEYKIGSRPDDERMIEEIRLEPPVRATETVINRIRGANLIILGPGSLQTSIVPNLVVDGVAEALRETKGKLVYIVNLFTNQSETQGYDATKFVSVIVKYIRRKLDLVLCNDASKMSSEVTGRYLRDQDSWPVWYDDDQRNTMKIFAKKVVKRNFLDKEDPVLARHSPKVAKTILDWYSSEVAPKRALVPETSICGA